jgi:hypothetical protein
MEAINPANQNSFQVQSAQPHWHFSLFGGLRILYASQSIPLPPTASIIF